MIFGGKCVSMPWIIIKPAKISPVKSEHVNIPNLELAFFSSFTNARHVSSTTRQKSVGRASISVCRTDTTTDDTNPSVAPRSNVPIADATKKGAEQYRAYINVEFFTKNSNSPNWAYILRMTNCSRSKVVNAKYRFFREMLDFGLNSVNPMNDTEIIANARNAFARNV
jgi:hypothetical protein